MNEQARELHDKAWCAVEVSYDFGHPISFADKLTELVVREVVKFIETEMHEDFANYPKWYKVIEKLENHFGCLESASTIINDHFILDMLGVEYKL
jgi:hypothetical protein